MRVLMLRTERFTPPEQRAITVKYLAGTEYTVKRAWGEAMVKDGAAEEIQPPKRAVAQPLETPEPEPDVGG